MAKIIWHEGAVADLDQAVQYIAQDSPDQASLFLDRVRTAVKRLEDFPASGRKVPESEDPVFRELIVGAYRVMYEVKGDVVRITAVVHGARKPDLRRPPWRK